MALCMFFAYLTCTFTAHVMRKQKLKLAILRYQNKYNRQTAAQLRKIIEELKNEDQEWVSENLSTQRTEENETVLDMAAQKNNIETINIIVKKAQQCLKLTNLLPFIQTPLLRAAKQNNFEVAEALLENLTARRKFRVINALDGMGKKANAYIPQEGEKLRQLFTDCDEAAKTGMFFE